MTLEDNLNSRDVYIAELEKRTKSMMSIMGVGAPIQKENGLTEPELAQVKGE